MVNKHKKVLIGLLLFILILILSNACFADIVYTKEDIRSHGIQYRGPEENIVSQSNVIELASSSSNLLRLCAIGVVIAIIIVLVIIIIIKKKKRDKGE